jgi:hypothetical protein
MAKISRHGGASFAEHEDEEKVVIRRAELGRVDQSVGTDSSASSKSEQTPNDSVKPSPRAPVPTTENPSKAQEVVEDSTAPLTDGDIPKTEQQQSAKHAAPKRATRTARVRATTDEELFDEFE